MILMLQKMHFFKETYNQTNPSFLSERMLVKNYDCKGSVVKKISDCGPQGAWRQDELMAINHQLESDSDPEIISHPWFNIFHRSRWDVTPFLLKCTYHHNDKK
jgi:hypothetical protein